MIDRYRSTVICLHDNKILGFQAEDPTSGKKYFFLPGGKIENGETPRESALRETMEETGYEIQLNPRFEMERTYPFFWDGQNYLSKTVFFAGILKNAHEAPQRVQDAGYHQGVAWISIRDIDEIFAYQKDILEAVKEALKFLTNF